MNDLPLITRQLSKSPGFTLTAVVTLALGIGATTALFTVVDSVLLRPLPYPKPAELVSIRCDLRGQGVQSVRISLPEMEDIQRRTGAFSEVAMTFPMNGNMTGITRPERVEALAVTPNYFHVLGVGSMLGRTFGPDEERVTGWAEGVVISHRAWQVLFGGDAAVLGRKFWMDYDTFRVVGVMPPSFRHPGTTVLGEVDVWFTGGLRSSPFAREPKRTQRIIPGLIARLQAGVSVNEAQHRLHQLATSLRTEFPDQYPTSADWMPTAEPLIESMTGRSRSVLLVLLAASACLVLICCASIASLQLARAAGRTRDTAIRAAVGATGWSLVRHALLENLLLAGAGAGFGLLVARWLIPALLRLAPADLPRAENIALDYRVLAFTAAVAVLTGLVMGIAPIRQILRVDVLSALKDGSARGGSGRSATHWRAALVAAQIAISVVLLSAAGLLVRSVWNLLNTDPGFNQRGVVVAKLWLPPPTDPNARQTYRVPANRIQFTRNLAEQLSAQPGIEAAAVGAGQSIPFTPWRASDLVVEGRTLEPGAAPQARVASVTPGYFDVLGLQLHRGRLLRAGDDHVNPVAVIDEQAARLLWPNDDAVGRRFAVGEGTAPQWITVVGVVSAMNTEGFDAPFAAHVYVSAYHRPSLDISVLLRSPLPAEVLAPMLRDVVRNIDPDLPVFSVRALEDIVVHTQAQRRFAFAVLVFFAVVALLLAALGVAGVTGLVTTQRRREFGVRVALGASGREMAKLVFGFGFRMALAGVVVGLVPAAVLCTALGSLLYGVRPIDPLTIGTMVIALAITVLVASLPAARRAARSNPSDALRAE